MPFYDAIRLGASGAADYEVERSLRFDDEQSSPTRLTRTVQSGGNLKKFTSTESFKNITEAKKARNEKIKFFEKQLNIPENNGNKD